MPSGLIAIESADDPRIAEFRDIRERDLTGRQSRFIAEGTPGAATAVGGSFAGARIVL